MSPKASALWGRHDRAFRDPRQVLAQWAGAGPVDPALLTARATGKWWETLGRLGITLLVTREYEHLVVALSARGRGPRTTCLTLPHPSGLAVDRARGTAWIASTRLPNQLFRLAPAGKSLRRADRRGAVPGWNPLVPVETRLLPGCLYLHDLAFIGGSLYGAAAGLNCIVRLDGPRPTRPAWWPRSVERRGRPDTRRNYLQLNSIAAGRTLRGSFFSASAAAPGRRYPGDPAFPVDGLGVVFSGSTRRPLAGGLTRPHSARLFRGRVWVDNSGYGEFGRVEDGFFRPFVRLPGWTRGLVFCGGIAFVGTSRVIPRFRSYAPGLDARKSVCGIHAVEMGSGRVLGSLVWPAGNQIFGIDWMGAAAAGGLPFTGARGEGDARQFFYTFGTEER